MSLNNVLEGINYASSYVMNMANTAEQARYAEQSNKVQGIEALSNIMMYARNLSQIADDIQRSAAQTANEWQEEAMREQQMNGRKTRRVVKKTTHKPVKSARKPARKTPHKRR